MQQVGGAQAPARLKHPRPLYKLHSLKVNVLSKTETENPPLPKKSKGHDAFISTFAVYLIYYCA